MREGGSTQARYEELTTLITLHSLSDEPKAPVFPLLGPRLLRGLNRFGTPTTSPTRVFVVSDWLISVFHRAAEVPCDSYCKVLSKKTETEIPIYSSITGSGGKYEPHAYGEYSVAG